MCRSWFYKAVNPPPRKADQLSLAMEHAVQVANVCSYRIMQIIRGGKLLRLHALLVIRGKTFAIA